MSNLVILISCLVIGILLQRVKTLPKDSVLTLNTIILYVCLPSLTLLTIPKLTWDLSLVSLCFVAWIIFFIAFFFFNFLGKILSWPASTTGCLILTAGLGNTAFVGFPIIESAFGLSSVRYAVLLDQAGTFLACSTIGLAIAGHYSHGRVPKRELLKRVLVFPPFVSFSFALALNFLQMPLSGIWIILLERLSSMLAPMALLSVGLQLKPKNIFHDWKPLSWGLFYKLILAPLIIFSIFKLIGVPHELFRVAVMEAAMASMLTASILATSHDLHPRLAGLMVGVGIPVSFITLLLWYLIL
jgi:malate permease and related proteins